MTHTLDRLSLMIAHAAESRWPTDLARTLLRLPVDLHWSQTDSEAIDLAASGGMHVAVVDDALPRAGGLDLLRRIRGLGLGLPCLLVCEDPDPRVLRDALSLDVFSVVQAGPVGEGLVPMVVKLVRNVYRVDWNVSEGMN